MPEDKNGFAAETEPDFAKIFPDLVEPIGHMAATMEGVLALRARGAQLIHQRANGGPWGPAELEEFQQTTEYLGVIDEQQRALEARSTPNHSRRQLGGNAISRLFRRKTN